MSFGDIILRVLITFLAVFFAVIMVVHFTSMVITFTDEQWPQKTVNAALVIASLTSLTWFFMYSRGSLSVRQVIVRYLLAYVMVLLVSHSTVEFTRIHYGWQWQLGAVSIYHVVAFFATTLSFVCIIGASALQAKIVTGKFNQGLQQHQHRKEE